MWENTTPSTELPRDFCAGIGPLQLAVVLFFKIIIFSLFMGILTFFSLYNTSKFLKIGFQIKGMYLLTSDMKIFVYIISLDFKVANDCNTT